MNILRGDGAPDEVVVREFVNDWISYDTVEACPQGGIVSPMRVRLNPDEVRWFLARTEPKLVGQFWAWWQLNPDGSFTSLRARRRT